MPICYYFEKLFPFYKKIIAKKILCKYEKLMIDYIKKHSVIYVEKHIKEYLFIDGGMADNMRPLLYKSKYTMAIANRDTKDAKKKVFTIAGKFCESGDILSEDVQLPDPEVGDTLVVFGTGAYNYTMASNYNRFRRPGMVLISEGQVQILVRPETYEDIIRLDQ